MRKTIRAMTVLTVGVLFASSGYAAQTVVVAPGSVGSGNRSGNVVLSNNRVNVVVVNRSFDGNRILSNNIVVTGGSVVGAGNSASLSGAVSIVTRSGNSAQLQAQTQTP